MRLQAAQAPPPPSPATAGLPDIRDLRARRSELGSQLNSATSRRNELASQLRNASPGADRSGIEARIAALDNRILTIETQLSATSRDIADAASLSATTEEPSGSRSSAMRGDQVATVAIIFTLAVLMPLAIAWSRAILRRARHATERPSPELDQRLTRIEEGIDAIAVEVERVSEGQRFVSKLLGEGARLPDRARRGEALAVRPPDAAKADAAGNVPGAS